MFYFGNTETVALVAVLFLVVKTVSLENANSQRCKEIAASVGKEKTSVRTVNYPTIPLNATKSRYEGQYLPQFFRFFNEFSG